MDQSQTDTTASSSQGGPGHNSLTISPLNLEQDTPQSSNLKFDTKPTKMSSEGKVSTLHLNLTPPNALVLQRF